jgi:inward rectifier potassium channel
MTNPAGGRLPTEDPDAPDGNEPDVADVANLSEVIGSGERRSGDGRGDPGDLGFGTVVARESRRRLLNRDGSFNVERKGLSPLRSWSLYHALLQISWPRFFLLVSLAFVTVNAAFATAFFFSGPGALRGLDVGRASTRWVREFFFSVHTLATIGYGNITPESLTANVLVTLEALVGLLGFGLAAGLAFARVSRPTAAIIFSNRAVIAPYRGMTAFQFRIANERRSQIVDLQAKVIFSRRRAGDRAQRVFSDLALERTRVAFFPLAWTIVHPIDDTSPLHGLDMEGLRHVDAEFLVLLSGTDETFSQIVQARSSYTTDELVYGARFRDIFVHESEDGILRVRINDLHDFDHVELT